MFLMFISIAITIIAIAVIIVAIQSKKIDKYMIKIEEAEKDLEISFETKLTLLTKLQQFFLEKEPESEFNFLCNLEEIENNEFTLNSILNNAYNELNQFIESKRNYIPDDETKQSLEELYQCDVEGIAIKNYYNNNVEKLNKIIKHLPTSLISKFKKVPKLELYVDPKEEEYEILKKK